MKKVYLPSVDSTNLYAKRQLADFPKDSLTMIVAETQTHGRGQFEKRWISPKGNLYVTFVSFLPGYPADMTQIPLKTARQIQEWLFMYGITAKIKWPNDLLVNHKKIAGILCETLVHENRLAVILGVGLNVNMTEQEASQIEQPATSLRMETGRLFDLNTLIEQFPRPVDDAIDQCQE